MKVEAKLHTLLTTELYDDKWSASRSGRTIPVIQIVMYGTTAVSDRRLRNLVTDAPMLPLPPYVIMP
jgi:hypothetical protein